MTRRLLRILLQAAALLLPLFAVYAWQTRDLLPADDRQPAPAFSLATLDGGRFRSESLQGRPTVLYFFAPWCKVCAASASQLRWFQRLAGDSSQVVLVALDYDSAAEVKDYGRRHELDLPILLGDAAIARDYRIRGYPTYYVIDADGRVAGRDFGLSTLPGLWWRSVWLGS
jgi:thiol-disulfide isomerase/thioredoxin